MASLLAQLRRAGAEVRQGAGDQLFLYGVEEGPLADAARAGKPEILAELRAAADALYRCPHCHALDYEPLRGPHLRGLRRCLNCGRRFRDHDDVRPVPAPPLGCRIHRNDKGEPRYGYGGSLGCARHLVTLDRYRRCPVSKEFCPDALPASPSATPRTAALESERGTPGV